MDIILAYRQLMQCVAHTQCNSHTVLCMGYRIMVSIGSKHLVAI